MIIKDKQYPTPWQKWFAWKRVRLNNKQIWLEKIERRKIWMWQHCRLTGEGAIPKLMWQYRYNGEIGQDPRDKPMCDEMLLYHNLV